MGDFVWIYCENLNFSININTIFEIHEPQKLQSSKRNIGDDTQDDGLDSALVILKYNNNEDKFGSEKYKMYEAYCNS